jgi:hypothetical protein
VATKQGDGFSLEESKGGAAGESCDIGTIELQVATKQGFNWGHYDCPANIVSVMETEMGTHLTAENQALLSSPTIPFHFGFSTPEKLRSFLASSKKWNFSIKRMRFHEYVKGSPTEQYTGILEQFPEYFDTTLDHLNHVFQSLDTDQNAVLSFSELRAGLSILHVDFSDEAFLEFSRHMDQTKSNTLSFEEFEVMVRRMKMLNLFNPDVSQTFTTLEQPHLSCLSYNFSTTCFTPEILDEEDFFFWQRPSWVTQRWIHLEVTFGALCVYAAFECCIEVLLATRILT